VCRADCEIYKKSEVGTSITDATLSIDLESNQITRFSVRWIDKADILCYNKLIALLYVLSYMLIFY
jgi:hypothetical protein